MSLRSWRYCRRARNKVLAAKRERRMGRGTLYFSRLRRSLLAAPPPKLYFARVLLVSLRSSAKRGLCGGRTKLLTWQLLHHRRTFSLHHWDHGVAQSTRRVWFHLGSGFQRLYCTTKEIDSVLTWKNVADSVSMYIPCCLFHDTHQFDALSVLSERPRDLNDVMRINCAISVNV